MIRGYVVAHGPLSFLPFFSFMFSPSFYYLFSMSFFFSVYMASLPQFIRLGQSVDARACVNSFE
jgi:hypothetical protein